MVMFITHVRGLWCRFLKFSPVMTCHRPNTGTLFRREMILRQNRQSPRGGSRTIKIQLNGGRPLPHRDTGLALAAAVIPDDLLNILYAKCR